MAKKAGPVDPLKAKEAKQKKIAIGGAVVLVILLAIQGPKLMKQFGQSSAPPPPPPATTPAAPAATTPTFSATPGAPTEGSGASSSDLAANAPTAAIGQLSSFGTFVSKDPFASQAPASGTATAPTPTQPTTTTTPPTPPAPPNPPTGTGTAAAPTSAVISVNGVQQSVNVGSDFPTIQPFFHLVSLTATTAKISIAGGSLASGDAAITLHVGKPVTLQNTTDGTRFTLQLYKQGTTVAATPGATTSTTTSSTTTDSTTTGTTTTN